MVALQLPTDEGNIGDITEAFYSFDVNGSDGVTDEDVLMIFLGLGYQPIDVSIHNLVDRRARLLTQSSHATYIGAIGALTDRSLWTLDQVVRVLSHFSRFKSNDATSPLATSNRSIIRNPAASTTRSTTAQLARLEHCNDTFALLDTNAKGYLNAQDIVNLSQKVCSTDTSSSNARTSVVSLPYAEQMLQHLTFTPQSPRQAASTVGTASTSSMSATAQTAAQMSRTEFYQFMSPKSLPHQDDRHHRHT